MTLHIFNPEHDIALASDLSNFTAPHAGRQLRHDLGFLPALWASEGDAVLVDDVEQARSSFQKMMTAGRKRKVIDHAADIRFVSSPTALPLTTVSPWGWDRALCARLLQNGVKTSLLPNDRQIETVRQLSHRRVAARLLSSLRREGTVGESFECTSTAEVETLLSRYGRLVLKAPWSSTGRGLRFCDTSCLNVLGEIDSNNSLRGWLKNLLDRQGSVMAEPYYNKVKDFGMEFTALADGTIRYEGLSLFHTANGAYTGNILATEKTKKEMLSRYLPISFTEEIQANICNLLSPVFRGNYEGPFGLDMMVVGGERGEERGEFMLHPCVEINLRRTMGHVALAMMPKDDDICAVMRIEYAGGYQLKLTSHQTI